MKFQAISIGAIVCVQAALGSLSTEARPSKIAERAASRLSGRQSQITYGDFAAGAVQYGTGFRSVTGTFVVPTPSNTEADFAASIWIGIEGNSTQTQILQSGLDIYVEDNQLVIDAWSQWHPNPVEIISGIAINAGDTITVAIDLVGTGEAAAVITNKSTGKSVTQDLSGDPIPIEFLGAQWIVEELTPGVEAFGQFSVTFTNCLIYLITPAILELYGAHLVDKLGISEASLVGNTGLQVTFLE
ncbi:peptidase A4 family-domain-containing protein [Xylariales sp. PMI_506]|nr:peptidase A4 family-domain-containing protein [Xylariales sp. PMI_506]